MRRLLPLARVALTAALTVALAGLPHASGQEGGTAAEDREDPRPNLLFAIADDWGWPHAGAYGDPVVRTPTFDRLAAEGALFDAAFVSSPSCTPSRNALLTGQAFFRLGEGANLWSTLAPEHPVFPLLLEDAGYHVGRWRKSWGPGNWKALGRERHPAGKRYGSFEDFLAARPDGAPFCFWLGAHDPHRGYERGSGAESGLDPDAVVVPPPLPDAPEVRGDVTDYYFEVERFDADVGRALALLEQRGELEHTLVVMTGDHGWPFPRGKTNLYDLGTRVPLAVRLGAAPGRGRTDRLVSLTDLAPTFLELAGLAVPAEMTGRSLLPWLRGEDDAPRGSVVFGRERHTLAQREGDGGYPMRGLRTTRYLYVENLFPDRWPAGWEAPGERPFRDCDNGPTKTWLMEHRDEHPRVFELCFGKRPAVELYDLERDPWQLTNLASDAEHADTRERLAAELARELERLGDPRAAGTGADLDRGPYRR